MPKLRKVYPISLLEKKRSNKKRILLNAIFLVTIITVCFAAGVVLGLLTALYIPNIEIFNNEENEFKFLFRNNKIVVGGNLQILLEIKNQAILFTKLYSENIQYFYYPIGQNYSCLLYNGGLSEHSKKDSTLQYKSEISTPVDNNEEFFSTKLSVDLNYILLNEQRVQVSIPFSFAYEITDDLKAEIQPLYNDCKNFNKIFFSIRLNTIHISNHLKTFIHNHFYEFIFFSKCHIDKNVDTFFNVQPKNKKLILKGLTSNLDLLK